MPENTSEPIAARHPLHLGDTAPEFLPAARGFDFSVGTVGNLGDGYQHGQRPLIRRNASAAMTSRVSNETRRNHQDHGFPI